MKNMVFHNEIFIVAKTEIDLLVYLPREIPHALGDSALRSMSRYGDTGPAGKEKEI